MSALLRVDNLRHAFGGIRVADGIRLTLGCGDRVALIGPNGAGKTSFVNLVCGLLRADGGRILLEGADISRMSDVARVRAGLVRSFQTSRLFAGMTVRQHLELACLARDGHTWAMLAEPAHMPTLATEVLRRCEEAGLARQADRLADDLAYGGRRMLDIAIALSLKPKVLILDEPAAGVGRTEVPRILHLLEQLPEDLAVLLIEHDMDLVFRFAKRIVVLAAGRIISEGSPADIAADEAVRRAYLGGYGRAPQ